jgi:hypothetical protein
MALHEADRVAQVCDPPLPAWDRLVALIEESARLDGVDVFVGRRLPRLLREAGTTGIGSRPIVQRSWRSGSPSMPSWTCCWPPCAVISTTRARP